MNDGIISVLLADDQRIIREGLRALLDAYPDIRVVAQAEDGSQAHTLTREYHPQVVLMDIRMPGMDGVEATRLIKRDFPETIVIILTTFDDDEYIIKAMTYGASGYLLKDVGAEKLAEAIRDGLSGNIILTGRVASKITSRLMPDTGSQLTRGDFTQREMDIIDLLLQGESNREIARKLYLSIGTVKNYVSQIYMKLDVGDRANAVLQLKRLGF